AEDAGEARQTASEKLRARQEAVAHQAARLWQMGKPAERLHPYLKAKALKPLHLRQLSRGRLLVPLCRDGRLANLQVIDARGDKRFLPGPVAGTYSPIGTLANNPRLYICEGWATGATLHQQTGCPVVCALSANNLKAVAVAMRTRYGDLLELVVAGDDDRQTLGNPGRCAADRAADAAGALVLFPQWPDDAPAHLSDFNDLHLWHAQKDGQS
ncbi:MAG: toprim domain-containing protein, partial [Pseudomonadota bacterium]